MQDPNTHYIGGTLNQTPIEVVDLETFLSEEGLPIATIEWERGWEHVLRMAIDTARADAVEEATPINPAKGVIMILRAYHRTNTTFPPFKSRPEAIAVLQADLFELQSEVILKEPDNQLLREKAIQLGAMALKFLVNCTTPTPTCHVEC